ncbi:MAG: hypothetical protein IKF71_02910 [Bacilli bacterium]|nr:hypothetical protein [Bacilli bacterium]
MYSIHSEKKIKGKIEDIIIHNTFPLGSSQKVYKIEDCDIRSISLAGAALASPMVMDLVQKKYQRLISRLTDLLTDDDDSGDSIREALNQIEKFRLEVKNKYRDFLKKKEMELMSTQLMILQKEAMERYLEMRNSFLKKEENKRSK